MCWTRLVLVRPAAVVIVLAHWNTTPRVSSDVPTQTIILTPSRPDSLSNITWTIQGQSTPHICITSIPESQISVRFAPGPAVFKILHISYFPLTTMLNRPKWTKKCQKFKISDFTFFKNFGEDPPPRVLRSKSGVYFQRRCVWILLPYGAMLARKKIKWHTSKIWNYTILRINLVVTLPGGSLPKWLLLMEYAWFFVSESDAYCQRRCRLKFLLVCGSIKNKIMKTINTILRKKWSELSVNSLHKFWANRLYGRAPRWRQ